MSLLVPRLEIHPNPPIHLLHLPHRRGPARKTTFATHLTFFRKSSSYPSTPISNKCSNAYTQTRIFLRFRNGSIVDSHASVSPDVVIAETEASRIRETLQGRKLHEMSIPDWEVALSRTIDADADVVRNLAEFVGTKLALRG